MPKKKKSEMKIIKAELAGMTPGQMKHVKVGPGRGGMVTIKKGKGGPVGSPSLVPKHKRRAKVIRGKGY